MKHCIGKDHVDFRTTQQQDAAQFLQYFLERLDRAELKSKLEPVTSSLLGFCTTTRLVCNADQKVKYKDSAVETIWSLAIPKDGRADVSPDPKRQKQEDSEKPATVTLQACIEQWSRSITVEDLRWPHLGNAVHTANQTVGFKSFPRYLLVQIQRYELSADWTPIKLDVHMDIPHDLNLDPFRSKGPQEGESLVPDDPEGATPAAAAKPVIDEAALVQLMDMGFSMNSCKRALTAVGGSNVEAAMGWVFEHNVSQSGHR